tara:strand:- start:1083 stop:1337 length:255 start_codon:yes stop_codon:yes gene_type:complete
MTGEFDNLRYMVTLVSEVDQVDFRQVFETSADTLRVSVDGVYTFFKWEGETPSSIEALTYKEGEFTHSEMLDYLNDPKWVSDPN